MSSKTAFIAQHPSKSANEIVALAKTKGMKLSTAYVYSTRNRAKSANGSAPPRAPKQSLESKASQLQRLILELGLDNARAVFARLESRLQ